MTQSNLLLYAATQLILYIQRAIDDYIQNVLLPRRPHRTLKPPPRRVFQRIQDQIPHIQIVRLTDMPHRIERTHVLDVDVGHARLVDERRRRRRDELVVPGYQHRRGIAWLSDWVPVIQLRDRPSPVREVVA